MKITAKLREDTRGSLMVETTLSFVMFVGVLVSIMSLVNIVTLHDRIQYAITQVASEISTYSYLYEATNLKAKGDAWNDHAGKAGEDLQAVIDGIGTIADTGDRLENAGSLGGIGGALNNSISAGKGIWDEVSHPKEFLQKIISEGLDRVLEGGKSVLLEGMSYGLSQKYIAVDASAVGGDTLNTDTYLRSFGVNNGLHGLDFSGSTLFSDQQTIDIVVQYDVNYKFALLPLPFTKIHMVQRVATSGWCGDGERYQ